MKSMLGNLFILELELFKQEIEYTFGTSQNGIKTKQFVRDGECHKEYIAIIIFYFKIYIYQKNSINNLVNSNINKLKIYFIRII